MKAIGIDKMAFATTDQYIDLTELAKARDVDPNKYKIGIGQDFQAVVPPTQDVVTLGAQAAQKVLSDEDYAHLSTVIVATESGIDNSKASGIYIKHLLGLDDYVRVVELKEACYSATAGIQFAKGLVALHPADRVLVIAADIARYGLKTAGEVTQGAGAVAMIVSADPRLLTLDPETASYTRDVMDFWRPLYDTEARVDGHYSTNVYNSFFTHTFGRYSELTGTKLDDYAALCFHLPFTKMGTKALNTILGSRRDETATRLRENLTASQKYCRRVGNLYTGSLYLGLMSLCQYGQVKRGDRIGLFSYGSGAEGEFYSGVLQDHFRDQINDIDTELKARHQVSIATYEEEFNHQLGLNSADVKFEIEKDHAPFVLTGQKDHQRQYQRR